MMIIIDIVINHSSKQKCIGVHFSFQAISNFQSKSTHGSNLVDSTHAYELIVLRYHHCTVLSTYHRQRPTILRLRQILVIQWTWSRLCRFERFDELSTSKEYFMYHVPLEVHYIILEQHLHTNNLPTRHIYCETYINKCMPSIDLNIINFIEIDFAFNPRFVSVVHTLKHIHLIQVIFFRRSLFHIDYLNNFVDDVHNTIHQTIAIGWT